MHESVLIDGTWYTVDVESLKITVQSPKLAYGTFEAWDELMDEPVILQYVSVNKSRPIAEKPHRIIRPEHTEE